MGLGDSDPSVYVYMSTGMEEEATKPNVDRKLSSACFLRKAQWTVREIWTRYGRDPPCRLSASSARAGPVRRLLKLVLATL